jgi:hypothetical protein
VSLFAVGYMYFITRKTALRQLDIYDLNMLSTVAIAPLMFVMFPRFSFWLAKIAGVGFPFVLMFGLLFAILFVFIHRLTVKIHRLESENRMFIQELSLLKQAIDSENE